MRKQKGEASMGATAGAGSPDGQEAMRTRLSTLWIFAVLNYIYADVFTAMDPSSSDGSVRMTHGFILAAAVLMETAIAMVPLSRFLRHRANRWANIVVGSLHTLAVVLSLLVKGRMTASYYVFFAVVEIASTSLIIWLAWNWAGFERRPTA